MVLSWWSVALLIAWGVITFPVLQLTNFRRNEVHLVPHIDVGLRPYFLINDMAPSALKKKLSKCAHPTSGIHTMQRTSFAIGHRGACLMFPEHTKESYEAAIRMGAGRVECDVAFTKDNELVCRHSMSDLHTTTDILLTPLAAKCTQPFRPYNPITNTSATAECRTTDITLEEFKTLRGKMDGFNPLALTPQEYVAGTPSWRTDLYAGPTSGTLMSHKDSIALFDLHGVQMTPELKEPVVPMPHGNFTRHDFADKIIAEYVEANIDPKRVFPQAFAEQDILYWLAKHTEFGVNGVFLDDADKVDDLPSFDQLQEYKKQGIQIVAPPIWALLTTDANNKIVPSEYAKNVQKAGLRIVTWSLDRAGIMAVNKGGWYYQTVHSAITREGDILETLHVLANQVGIESIFSDWAASVVYYANCLGHIV